MNPYVNSRFSWPSVLVGAVGVLLALSAVIAWAMFAHADTGPTVTATIFNSSNATTSTAALGTPVHAFAQVASTTGTTTPTGTVTFNRFSNTSCSGTPTPETVALVGGSASSSATAMPNTGISYIAHYNGDTTYPAAQSACIVAAATAPNTALSTALSSTSVLAGATVTDSATLSSSTASAGGTLSYTVYTNNSCTQGATNAGTVTVSNGTVPNSNPILFSTPGTYYWQAVYSGDGSNAAATSTCGSEALTVNSTSTAPTTAKISVDEVTNPSGDPTSFNFTTTGSGYSNFSLTDAATPNMQTLNPGSYSVSQSVPTGWTLTGASCATNNGSFQSYTPGSAIALSAGNTVSCTFFDTKISSSTSRGGRHFCDSDEEEALDRCLATSTAPAFSPGEHEGFFDGLPFGIFKHIFGGIHDHGKHKGEEKHDSQGDNNNDDNDD